MRLELVRSGREDAEDLRNGNKIMTEYIIGLLHTDHTSGLTDVSAEVAPLTDDW